MARARSSSASSRPCGGQVVEGDGEQPLPRAGAVPEDRAGRPRQPRREQGEGAGRAAARQVGADPGDRRPAGGASFGGPHAGDRARVGRQGLGGVARGQESRAYGFDERVPYALDGPLRVLLGAA